MLVLHMERNDKKNMETMDCDIGVRTPEPPKCGSEKGKESKQQGCKNYVENLIFHHILSVHLGIIYFQNLSKLATAL